MTKDGAQMATWIINRIPGNKVKVRTKDGTLLFNGTFLHFWRLSRFLGVEWNPK